MTIALPFVAQMQFKIEAKSSDFAYACIPCTILLMYLVVFNSHVLESEFRIRMF